MLKDDEIVEKNRLKALKDYEILDTVSEHTFDAITRLAAAICKAPVALITFLDEERQWFKARVGTELCETPRELSFCRYTIRNDTILEIPDTTKDPRFSSNPFVTGDSSVRFYAGAPLISPDGFRLGALCVTDTRPRKLNELQKTTLQTLASEVVMHLEAARKNRQLHQLLAESQDFKDLFNYSADIHCILNEKGEIGFINKAVEQLLGYTVEEALGRTIWDFCFPGERDLVMPSIENGMAGGKTHFEVETRVLTKDGDIRYFSWSDVFRNGRWFIHGRDVTLQKENEDTLRQLSVVARHVNSGIAINNADSEVIWVNKAFENITGYSLNDVKGKRVGDILKGENTDVNILEYARGQTRNKRSFTVDILSYRKNGEPVWLSVMNSFVLDVNGEAESTVEIITDITEHKKAELELQSLSLAVSKASVGVLIRDRKNRILWLNEAFEKGLGYSFAELKGEMLGYKLVGPETDPAIQKIAAEALEAGRPYEIEVVLYRKDGTPVWFWLSNNPIFNESGVMKRQVCIAIDITNRKKAEDELIRTREEAVQLGKAKEAFLSVMSHEIRTPLNAIIGMTRILLDDNPPENQIENLNILKFSSENLLNLINDILDFTKIESGNVELESVDINLKELVSHTLESLVFKVADKKIALKYEIDPRIPEHVKGDSTRLYQIFINLLGNAVKFTSEGEIKLSLTLVDATGDDVSIRFEVSDTGIGIPADKINTIFEPYTQAGSDITRKYGGTGLGLAITSKLIELYHSAIYVESEEGKGSLFYFTIRFKNAVPAINRDVYKAESILLPSKALVVDDNAINRLIAGKVLNKWQVETDFAENGQEALDKIRQNDYDLVFMDLHMPVMDGYEATRQIRLMQDPKYQSLPVIALTASKFNIRPDLLRQTGMNDVVVKPFNLQELYDKIRPYLEKPVVRDIGTE